MQITIEIPDELVTKTITSIMENFPEASADSSLQCVSWKYKTLTFEFKDHETGKVYKPTIAEFQNGFHLMFTNKWPKGCTPIPVGADPEDWDNWLCQADAVDFDAFIQLAILGDVIYG